MNMQNSIQYAAQPTTPNRITRSWSLACSGALLAFGFASMPAQAVSLGDINNKVTTIKNQVSTIKGKATATLSEVQLLSSLKDAAGSLADTTIIATIADAVQPVVQMVEERRDAFAQFNAQLFRSELSAAVQSIADMQLLLVGHVGPGITRLQMQLASANDHVLYALSETPLVELIELTEGLGGEITSLIDLTSGAIADIQASYATDQVLRLTSLGMSAAAPSYVSCGFVLQNVSDDDIDNLGLLRLRMKQISGVTKIALEILPKSQTIGVNVVGGATLSIPNPVTPMVSAIKKIADKYYDISEDWTDKYDDCAQDALMERLDLFLASQGQ